MVKEAKKLEVEEDGVSIDLGAMSRLNRGLKTKEDGATIYQNAPITNV